MIYYFLGILIQLYIGFMETVCCLESGQIKPTINIPSKRFHVQMGRKLFLLECHVQGTMPLNISWLKSGIRIRSNSSYSTGIDYTEMNTTTYQLWITEMTADAFGHYTCSASNNYGKDEKNVTVELAKEPEELVTESQTNGVATHNNIALCLWTLIGVLSCLHTNPTGIFSG